MRRAMLGDAIAWIAANDEPADTDATRVERRPTVQLVAEMFGTDPAAVAGRVIEARAPIAKRDCAVCKGQPGDTTCRFCRGTGAIARRRKD